MVLLRRWPLMVLALIFGVSPLLGASSDEERALTVASDKLGSNFYEAAEKDFGDFVQKYPYSVHIPEAILYRAQARFDLGQYTSAIDLLSTNQEHADKLVPQYLYLIGRAYFENQDYDEAASTFDDFVKKYPESKQSLDAQVREAGAFARQERWPRVIELLEQTNGVFQKTVRGGAATETVSSGYLLLGDARLAEGKFAGVDEVLRALDKQTLNSRLKWQRDYLASRRQQAEGRVEDALLSSASLLTTPDSTNRAEGVAFQAGVLEQLGHLEEAVNAYTNNLTMEAPPEQQRRAILKIAELDLKLEKLPDAVQSLQVFLKQFPYARANDLAMLTLGEVRLKQALSGSDTNLTGGESNLFEKALAQFDNLLNSFTNNPLAGKALLDRGWALWSQGKIAESEEPFHSAVVQLPFSEEQAEARFKWADALYELKNLQAAMTNYNYLAENYSSLPGARDHLIERALYQSMRAALDANDLTAATNALEKILAWYPDGFAGPVALLLTGQGLAGQKDPAAARKLFETFEKLYPTSSLLPEVRLAIARSYEVEGNWDTAITSYSAWADTFTNHSLIPQAKFNLAWDNYMAGHETNALMLFSNFVTQFPTNVLSARAQWWMGDYYFGKKDWTAAELNYQLVYQNTNLPPSDMTYQARMMAGRAAMSRTSYKQAIGYFTNLMSPDCPLELQVQATLAFADALSLQESTNKPADLNEAIQSLMTIPQSQSNSWAAAQAWGKIGDCYVAWGAVDPDQYTNAAPYYRKVLGAREASGAAKSEARFNLGSVLEKQAALKSGDEQTGLLKQALNAYVDAFYQDLRDPDKASPLWTKKAAMQAGQLAEALQEWQSAYCMYSQLKTLLPVMAPLCERRMQKAFEHGASPERCGL